MKFLIVCLYFLIGLSNAAHLAKIFKNGMVLQSNPTTAVIWGWQEGNPDDWPPVYLTADCENEDGMFKINKRFISKKVWVLKIYQLQHCVLLRNSDYQGQRKNMFRSLQKKSQNHIRFDRKKR